MERHGPSPEDDDAPLELPVDGYLRRDNDEPVVGVSLGLTTYLADPTHWAKGAITKALEAFLARVPTERLGWYTTSLLTEWRRLGPRALPEVVAALTGSTYLVHGVRHQFFFRIADTWGAPGLGFSYTEIDPARATRAGVLELTLDQAADPGQLFQLAMELARLGPLHCAVGGYALRWHVRYQRLAFNAFYYWAKRYLGIDAQDAEAMAWKAPVELPGTSWLTFIGKSLAATRERSLEALAIRDWQHGVTAIAAPGGLLLRAGDAPTRGDCNNLACPHAYAEVARALADDLVQKPPELWGNFLHLEATRAWFRRLVEPKGWP
jgi:hypothetical protein